MLKIFQLPNLFLFSPLAATRGARKRIIQKSGAKPASRLRQWMGILLVGLNTVVLLSYLIGINSYASKGYEIKRLQGNISRLAEANEKLNLKVSEASSMAAIQADLQNSGFVAAGTAKYLQVNPVAMTLK